VFSASLACRADIAETKNTPARMVVSDIASVTSKFRLHSSGELVGFQGGYDYMLVALGAWYRGRRIVPKLCRAVSGQRRENSEIRPIIGIRNPKLEFIINPPVDVSFGKFVRRIVHPRSKHLSSNRGLQIFL
jgi:hypothetical protein